MASAAELRTQLSALVRAMDPNTMTGEQAAALVAELARVEKLAATGRMFAAVRVAQTDAWRGQGHLSATDWLAAQAGITVAAAAAQLGTAKKAAALPKTKKAMEQGDLSPEQAGAVAEGATADPAAEDSLLDSAAHDTTSQLKDKAAKAKAAATDTATRERRIRSQRSLRTRTDADGAGHLHLYGPSVDVAALLALLRPYQEHAFRHARTGSTRDTFDNRSYDAFFTMLAHLHTQATTATSEPAPESTPEPPTPPGPPVPTPDQPPAPEAAPPPPPPNTAPPNTAEPAPPDRGPHHPPPPWTLDPPLPLPAKVPGGHNTKVIVLIDHTALLRGHTIAGETCEIAGLGPIAATTARELMHDAFIAVAIRKGKDIINVAHSGRGLNAHQRTALEATGLRCSNRACNHTIAIQIDHRTPYHQDPTTTLDNQDPLCPDCHRRKTHHGWHLEPGTGPRTFLPPTEPSGAQTAPTRHSGPQGAIVEQPSLDLQVAR